MDRFIDAHCRLQGFSFDAWELQGMCGMAGALLSCGDPRVHREVRRRVPDARDVMRLWDSPIRMAEVAEARHRVRAMCAVGVSPATRVEGWERLIDALPGYLENARVAALGETGLDPDQRFGRSRDVEDQARRLEAQARVAAEAGKPLILRAPALADPEAPPGGAAARGEGEAGEPSRRWLRMSLDVVDGAGLDHALLVVNGADEATVDFVHAETGAWCGVSLGDRLRPVSSSVVLGWVRRFGAARVLLGSDLRPDVPNDVYGVPRAIRAMRRGGVAEEEIQKAAFDNANALFGFGLRVSPPARRRRAPATPWRPSS